MSDENMSILENNSETVNESVSGTALTLANVSGIAVFPCNQDKRPLTTNGFKAVEYDIPGGGT